MSDKIILLVEDNPDDIALTLRAMNKNNIANEVIVARDGAEALDWLFCEGVHAGRDPFVLPLLVMLDLNLPKVGGIEVLRRIRACERTRFLPVVALTTSIEQSDVAACYDQGINSYIQKPVDFQSLIEAVRQLGMYWLILNKVPYE